jgi:hypothetical protein
MPLHICAYRAQKSGAFDAQRATRFPYALPGRARPAWCRRLLDAALADRQVGSRPPASHRPGQQVQSLPRPAPERAQILAFQTNTPGAPLRRIANRAGIGGGRARGERRTSSRRRSTSLMIASAINADPSGSSAPCGRGWTGVRSDERLLRGSPAAIARGYPRDPETNNHGAGVG